MKNNTKMVVTAGLFASIYAVFFIISMQVGGSLESYLFFLLPLPLAIFSYEYGFINSLIPYVSICIIGFLMNPLSTIVYVVEAGIVGCLYGYILKNKKRKYLLPICLLGTIVAESLSMFVFAKFLNYSVEKEIYELFELFINLFKLNITYTVYIDRIIYLLIPLFFLCLSITEGLLIHLSIIFVMNRLKLISYSLLSIYIIRIPKIFAVIYNCLFIAKLLTFNFFYNGNGFIYVLAFIISLLFYLSSLLMCVEGFLTLNILISNNILRILYIIVIMATLILCPIALVYILSILGNIFVYSEYRSSLLYNNKSLRR